MDEKTILDRMDRARVLVAGDFLLDEYVLGDISRVSREAPVLILRYASSDFRPGGAANTVANVAALGARALAAGYVGDDEWGAKLLELWPGEVDASAVLRCKGLATTRKARILAGSFQSFRQQVVRLDYERPHRLNEDQQEKLCREIEKRIPEVDAVILSDYSLGNLTERVRQRTLDAARKAGKPVAVDSRDRTPLFAGADTLTPNVSELERALNASIGEDEPKLEEVARHCLDEWNVQALLVTRGKLGLSLVSREETLHVPAYGSGEVADVTGAGDTVAAVYATSLAAGASRERAARLANRAGGIVVCKRGTAAVTREELDQGGRVGP